MSSSRLIDGKQSAFERWELPAMQGLATEDALHSVTAEKLADIQKQAYEEGFKQGHQEGFAAGQDEVQAQVLRLHQIMQELTEPLEAVNEQVEEELFALAMAIARQIIRREIQQDPSQVIATVREAMGELPVSARQISICLHPDDAALVREAFSTEEAETAPWRIVEDMVLTRGSCRIESDNSRIDASVEKRLNTIMAEMLGGSRADDSSD